jgi:hypothetical protein
MVGNSRVAADLASPQEGLSSISKQVFVRPGMISGQRQEILSFSTASRPGLGATSLLSNGYGGQILEVKRLRRGSVHSHPSSAQFNSSTRLHGVVLNSLRTVTNLPF